MAFWGNKWGGFKWGATLPPDSEAALWRAIVSGPAPWLPVPQTGYPSGGNPVDGTALERHMVTHAYLLAEDDWTVLTELVGVTGGSRSSSINGWASQDTLTLTLWDPTDYFTDGPGRLLLSAGRLIKIVSEINSAGGTITAPMGIYRISGQPGIARSRKGTQITINGVEWWRGYLGLESAYPSAAEVPGYNFYWVPVVTNQGSMGAQTTSGTIAQESTPWPTMSWNLDLALSRVVAQPGFLTYAAAQFTNRRVEDFGDGNGAQPIWATSTGSYTAAALQWMLGINGLNTFFYDKLVFDANMRDPFGSVQGKWQDTQSLGPEFLYKRPTHQEILTALNGESPFLVVMGGDGVLHIRNPVARYTTPFLISCDTDIAGVIQLPAESVTRRVTQPEYTSVITYTQVNPQTDTTGKVVNQGSFLMRSLKSVPGRMAGPDLIGVKTEKIIYDTKSPAPTAQGDPPPSTLPYVFHDDNTAASRIVEIITNADQVTVTMDSAFPWIKLGDEVRVALPGIRAFFRVISISQPFDTGAMTLTMSFSEEG